MPIRVLSLDVSAASTGWAFVSGKTKVKFKYGLIKTSPKFLLPERLTGFRKEIIRLLIEFRPSHVVMEDVFAGLNPKTLVTLAKFSGVATEAVKSMTGIDPFIIHTNTVKSYFKAKNKEAVFYAIADILEWELEEMTFKKHNDISDALAQLLCYCDQKIKVSSFRSEQPYGYLYEV